MAKKAYPRVGKAAKKAERNRERDHLVTVRFQLRLYGSERTIPGQVGALVTKLATMLGPRFIGYDITELRADDGDIGRTRRDETGVPGIQ